MLDLELVWSVVDYILVGFWAKECPPNKLAVYVEVLVGGLFFVVPKALAGLGQRAIHVAIRIHQF